MLPNLTQLRVREIENKREREREKNMSETKKQQAKLVKDRMLIVYRIAKKKSVRLYKISAEKFLFPKNVSVGKANIQKII